MPMDAATKSLPSHCASMTELLICRESWIWVEIQEARLAAKLVTREVTWAAPGTERNRSVEHGATHGAWCSPYEACLWYGWALLRAAACLILGWWSTNLMSAS